MSKFTPGKLNVEFKDNISIKGPIIPRKYTLTHSDETGDLFLTIDNEYAYEKINPIRDEVLGAWVKEAEEYILDILVDIDGGKDLIKANKRDKIFREELPLALRTIIYADEVFIKENEKLNNSKIRINFKSKYPEYNLVEIWGRVSDYKIKEDEIYRLNNPMPITIPIQFNNKKSSSKKLISKALLAILNPYIKTEVYIIFGRNTPYCLNKAEILKEEVVEKYGPCNEAYEITVGLSVGKKAPPYNNMIITFLITDSVVKVMKVKNPK